MYFGNVKNDGLFGLLVVMTKVQILWSGFELYSMVSSQYQKPYCRLTIIAFRHCISYKPSLLAFFYKMRLEILGRDCVIESTGDFVTVL